MLCVILRMRDGPATTHPRLFTAHTLYPSLLQRTAPTRPLLYLREGPRVRCPSIKSKATCRSVPNRECRVVSWPSPVVLSISALPTLSLSECPWSVGAEARPHEKRLSRCCAQSRARHTAHTVVSRKGGGVTPHHSEHPVPRVSSKGRKRVPCAPLVKLRAVHAGAALRWEEAGVAERRARVTPTVVGRPLSGHGGRHNRNTGRLPFGIVSIVGQ
jgi:hypothetical protein